MHDQPTTAVIIPFAPRRKPPRMCVAIRGLMFDNANSLESLCIMAANDQRCGEVT